MKSSIGRKMRRFFGREIWRRQVFTFAVLLSAAITNIASGQKLENLFEEQLALWPQERLYIHTDKSCYIAGEVIWFRAHLVDAATFAPAASRYVYVELIDPLGGLVSRVKVRPVDGVFGGYIELSDQMAGGDYLLRGYTRLMEASGEEYFFKKTVLVGAPFSARFSAEASLDGDFGEIPRLGFRFYDRSMFGWFTPDNATLFGARKGGSVDGRPLKPNNKGELVSVFDSGAEVVKLDYTYDDRRNVEFVGVGRSADDFDVAFLPEGGHMICGRPSRVAFKAVDSSGRGVDVSVTLVSGRGDTLGTYNSLHRGMGCFVIAPERGESYHAVCSVAGGTVKRFDLPGALDSGVSLRVDRNGVMVYLHAVVDGLFSQPLNLIVQSRGVLVDAAMGIDAGKIVSVDCARLPLGVVQFVLTDQNMNPLSERLIFNYDASRTASMEISTDKPSYSPRDHVRARLKVASADGQPLAGSFSVSVTDDRYVDPDDASDIFSTLLLTSELRGHIESPSEYFRDVNDEKLTRLDLLMMTQGWSRYDVAAILRGNPTPLTGYIELGPVLSGELRTAGWGRPVGAGFPVSVISFETASLQTAETDDEGRFSFDLPELPDGIGYLVQGNTRSGRQYVRMIPDVESWPAPVFSVPYPLRKSIAGQHKEYMQRANAKYEQEHGVRLVQLDTITVRGRYIRPKYRHSTYPDVFLSGKAYDNSNISEYGSIATFLAAKGFNSGAYTVVINGMLSEEWELLETYNMADIGEIILLKGADAYFATRGAVGSKFKRGPEPVSQPKRQNNNFPGGQQGGFGDWMQLNRAVLVSIDGGFVVDNGRNDGYTENRRTVTPLGYQPHKQFYSPRYDTPAERASDVPDLRTTVYWNPGVTVDDNGTASFDFYCADSADSYTITVEGVASDGRPVWFRRKIGR